MPVRAMIMNHTIAQQMSRMVQKMSDSGVAQFVEKVTNGITVIFNGNPTVVAEYKPTIPNSDPYSEGMRPKGRNTFNASEWRTIDPNNPLDSMYIDKCPSEFGLKLQPASQ